MRIYLSAPIGMYQNKHTAAAAGGSTVVHRVLLSYLPQFKTVEPMNIALDRCSEPVDYCVDSGAHVRFNDFFKKILKPVAEVEAFITHFLASVEKLERKPSFLVELDLQRLYGFDTIARWRRDIWMPFEARTGIRICYVWHPIEHVQSWVDMIEHEHIRFLGIGGVKALTPEQRTAMVLAAYRAGKPVHAFAGVNVKWMREAPWFSVDSTSWAVGAQAFGNAVQFDPHTGGLRRYRVGNAQVRKNSSIAALGLLQTKLHASDIIDRGRERNKKNYARYYAQAAAPYQQLEEWHSARWKLKGINWEERLKQSGNGIENAGGGYLKTRSL